MQVIEELNSTTGCRDRGLNLRHLSLRASTLPLCQQAFKDYCQFAVAITFRLEKEKQQLKNKIQQLEEENEMLKMNGMSQGVQSLSVKAEKEENAKLTVQEVSS